MDAIAQENVNANQDSLVVIVNAKNVLDVLRMGHVTVKELANVTKAFLETVVNVTNLVNPRPKLHW